jgi:hypothetical protein
VGSVLAQLPAADGAQFQVVQHRQDLHLQNEEGGYKFEQHVSHTASQAPADAMSKGAVLQIMSIARAADAHMGNTAHQPTAAVAAAAVAAAIDSPQAGRKQGCSVSQP